MGNYNYFLRMNITILALIGAVSAADLKRHRRTTYQTAKLDD